MSAQGYYQGGGPPQYPQQRYVYHSISRRIYALPFIIFLHPSRNPSPIIHTTFRFVRDNLILSALSI